MPVTRTATRALRKSARKADANRPVRSKAATLARKALKNPTAEAITAAFSAVDKAVKKGLYHKNKASRLKSQISKAAAAK